MATGWLIPYGDGVRVTEQDVRDRSAVVPFIVGFGGGVDSTAMVIGLVQRGLRPSAILFADTKGEAPETYAAVERFAEWCFDRMLPFVRVVRHSPNTGDRSLEESCLRLKTLPSRAFGQSSCAFKWKIEAQEQWIAKSGFRVKGQRIIKALGYDAGEDYRATVHEDSGYRYWYPLIEWAWSRDECKRVIAAEGLPIPPKSACFFCPSAKPEEVVRLWENHPDLYERAVAMERRFRAEQFKENPEWDKPIPGWTEEVDDGNGEVVTVNHYGGRRSVVGLGRHWTWESVIAMAKEERANLPAPAPGCVICSESDCDLEAA